MFVFQMYLCSSVLVHFIHLLWNKNSPEATWKGERLVHLSRKPLECLYIWEQLTQSEAIILQQAWKQVVPVTSTRCATECPCVNQPSVQGHIIALPSQTDLHPLGLAGYVLHHLNLQDRKGQSLTCGGFSALRWTILPFSLSVTNLFPLQLSKWDWWGSFVESSVLPHPSLERRWHLCGVDI